MADDKRRTPQGGVPKIRGDEKTPLGGTKRPATPYGVPIVPQRAITERGGGLDRDQQKPKHGRMDPSFEFEGATDQYQGEELERIRSRRPTEQRIGHIEKKFDKLESKVDSLDQKADRTELAVAKVEATLSAEMKNQSQMLQLIREELKASRDDKHMVLKQTFDISGAEAKGKTEAFLVATKGKWKTIVTVVSGVFSVSVLSAFLALLASGKC